MVKRKKIDKIKAVFYKSNKPLFELFDMEEIVTKAGFTLPRDRSRQIDINVIRQFVYAIQRVELEENGRILGCIKMPGEKVRYGFIKAVQHLINNFKRMQKRFINQKRRVREIRAQTLARLPQAKQALLES